MIFLRYESFRGYLRMYPVTSAVLAINLLLFILDVFSGQTRPIMDKGMFILWPGDSFGMQEPWRYVTAIFLHDGLSHVLYNCFSLLVFAPPLEKLLGHLSYTVFYLLSGIAGNFASAVIYSISDSITGFASVGASGAVYGIFGAYLFMAIFRKHTMDEASRKTVYTILIFGLIYSVLSPKINIWAHIGGGIGGFLLYPLFLRFKRSGTEGNKWN